MKELLLNNSDLKVLVDDEDYENLSKFEWKLQRSSKFINNNYAIIVKDNNTICFMHYMLMPKKEGFQIDHIDGNGLNNQKSNIRYATIQQNSFNKRKQRGNYSSKYKGVDFFKVTSKWRARIILSGREMSLGLFNTEVEAAEAYNEAAKKYYKEFARLNEIDNVTQS